MNGNVQVEATSSGVILMAELGSGTALALKLSVASAKRLETDIHRALLQAVYAHHALDEPEAGDDRQPPSPPPNRMGSLWFPPPNKKGIKGPPPPKKD